MSHHLADERRLYVQAHRGFSERYPENTMLAIEEGLKVGVDQVEIDLGLSRDGEIIVLHDETVDRTTDGSGKAAEYSFAELQQLDAGSWKDPAFAGERIPRLLDVLRQVGRRGVLCMEIKSRGRDEALVAEIARLLPAMLAERGALGDVMISSFDVGVLLAVKRREPTAKLMLIDWDPPEAGGLEAAIGHGLYCWTPRPSLADEPRIRRAVQAGLTVQVDIYNLHRVAPLLEQGVRGFGADNPAVLMKHLASQGAKPSSVRSGAD